MEALYLLLLLLLLFPSTSSSSSSPFSSSPSSSSASSPFLLPRIVRGLGAWGGKKEEWSFLRRGRGASS